MWHRRRLVSAVSIVLLTKFILPHFTVIEAHGYKFYEAKNTLKNTV